MKDGQRSGVVQTWLDAGPSVAAVTAWVAGLTVEKWLGVLGIVFLALQIVGYLWRLRRDMRREDDRRASRMPADEGDSA